MEANSSEDGNERFSTPPFLLKLFYRNGAFHKEDEFLAQDLPPYLEIHTWEDCTLGELTHHIAAARTDSPLLPDPAIGTRVGFRLVFPGSGHLAGAAAAASTRGHYRVKDLGSVLIGDGGRGILKGDGDDADLDSDAEGVDQDSRWDMRIAPGDASKTLADAKFVVGDYISCAILPPLPSGLSVTAAVARAGRGPGFIETRSSLGEVLPPPYRRDGPTPRGVPMQGSRIDQFGRTISRRDGGGAFNSGYGDGVPNGEWRRGEQLPDGLGGRPRGHGRW